MNRIVTFVRHTAALLAVASILSPQRIFSQEAAVSPAPESGGALAGAGSPLSRAPQAITLKRPVETSFSVGAFGALTAARIRESSSALITQSLAPSAGVLATFRQSFRPWLGYSVNFGYTRANYRYTAAAPAPFPGTTVATYIPNHVYETSVSYIAQKHLTNRLTVFGEAGAGAIAFASINRDIRSSPPNFYLTYRNNNFRPEGITGFGFDYRMGHGLGLRAEYRGLFVKYPDYASGSIRPTTISSQPAVSLTYTFGTHKKH